MADKDVLGRRGEDLAARFLEQQGLVVLSRNWRCRHGEVDLVATDADKLVVCEVKTRSGTRFGEPAEAVTGRKAARIRRVTQAWLASPPDGLGRGPVRRAGRAGRARPAGHRPALPGGVLMGLARTWSVALLGVDGRVVEIEADVGGGLPRFQLVGLPDAALHEAKDRIRAAITNSGRTWPNERIVLALSPASLRKTGSGFDLALAVAILGAGGVVEQRSLERTMLLGELALDGRLRPVRGVLPCLLAARTAGLRRAVVPESVLGEAALVDGIEVFGAGSLAAVLGFLQTGRGLARPGPVTDQDGPAPPDLADVVGQQDARQALEIAAAGGHHVLLVGPPGTGKTMLAQRFVGLLPRLNADEALALAAIRSVAGRLPDGRSAQHGAADGGAAPLQLDGRAGRRRQRAGPARCGLAGPPGPAVHRRGSRVVQRTCSTRCAPRWRRARSGWPAPRARSATRPASSCCWPPTRARAPRRTTATACARR